MKLNIANYMRECYLRGWISKRDGNISFKKKNSDYYYISPAGVRKSEIKQDDVLKVDLYNNKIIEK